MPEANQTATPTDAREASMSRVQTQDSVLASLAPQKAALEPADGKPDAEKNKNEGDQKPKKGAQERIQELAAKRREAEAKADEATRENADLKARLEALSAQAKPLEAGDKPLRSQFATEDEYIESLTDYKAKKAIAKREEEELQARVEAEEAEIAKQWEKRQEKVMKALPDYADVVGKSEAQVPAHVHRAILESDQGPQIAYYLALHPAEAKRIELMKPIAAIKRIAALERDLQDIDAEDAKPEPAKETPKPQRSKAPEPIEPVKSVPSASSGSGSDYEEYKRRRQAQKGQ
jgi:chromosome segregation ATPase